MYNKCFTLNQSNVEENPSNHHIKSEALLKMVDVKKEEEEIKGESNYTQIMQSKENKMPKTSL